METWIVFTLVALSAAYLLKGLVKTSSGAGCASGCGACRRTCALRKLEERLGR